MFPLAGEEPNLGPLLPEHLSELIAGVVLLALLASLLAWNLTKPGPAK